MRPLSPDRWRALSGPLDELLALADDAAQDVWLRALAERDSALSDDLRTLLKEHRVLSHQGFLDASPALEPIPASRAGQTAGPYRLVSLIGQGGMGSVWLAERSDGRFERRTAIKFLSMGLAGRGEARFRREGRILGRLEHPRIAALIDAGVDGSGQPYLVLEYVDGVPIDEWCDGQRDDLDRRLELFLEVLDAVDYAHANLIVHRDLKPSNVLVGRDGHAKLLDFGIATLLEDDETKTADLGAAFTPGYAAPEQLTGGAITTGTDVYALGGLLYTLLTGLHSAPDTVRSISELTKAIVETETPAASAVVGAGNGASERAVARRSTPERLSRALRGDLDTILAKALKKEPGQRYQSVSAFAADLRRYRQHEPISARPDALSYRAAMFLRRYHLQVGVAVAIVGVLSAGLYFVNQQRAIAERRFVLVRELATRFIDIDAQVRQLPGAARARQVIVDASLEYLRRLTPDAEEDQDLALEVGTAYMRVARVQGVPISPNLGQVDLAQQNERLASSLIARVLSVQPTNRTAILRAAQIAHDEMILAGLSGQPDRAFELGQESSRRLEQYLTMGEVPKADAEQVVITMINVANRYRQASHFDEAIQMTERTIALATASSQPRQANAALTILALTYREKGDLEGALQTAHQAVERLTPAAGDENWGPWSIYILALIREGQILGEADAVSLSRPEEAIPLLERAVQLADTYAEKDPREAEIRQRFTTAGLRLADILRDRDPARALREYDRVLRRASEIQGNAVFRRVEVDALVGSSYALRRLGNAGEARRRLDDAFGRMQILQLYPADKLELGSQADLALRARIAEYVDDHDLPRAITAAEKLLAAVLTSGPHLDTIIADAYSVSQLYDTLAGLNRRAGRTDEGAALDKRRLDLWLRWSTRLPGNPFIAKQLALH